MAASVWADALGAIKGGGPVYVAGCTGEPTAFLDAIEQDPGIAGNRCFTGVWIPGVNRRDPTTARNGSRAVSTFVTPALQDGIRAGRVSVMPLHYSDTYRWLAGPADVSGAVFQVSPPQYGHVSLGVSVDFTPAVIAADVLLIGQINPAMPAPKSAPRIAVDRFHALIEAESPLLSYDSGAVSGVFENIARNVVALIPADATLQLGLGKLQTAVLSALPGARRMAFNAGMISEPLLARLNRGDFEAGVTTGVALGDADFCARCATDARITFAPVAHTHDQQRLAAIRSFVSVNSILEIDLFGQGNGEFIAGRQITGHGGLLDFIRGARASEGGRAILALPSTAGQGATSRIVLALAPGLPATVARADIDWVVTENGAVNLRYKSIDERAEALISVAAPAFRDDLGNEWARMRGKALAE